MCVPWVLQPCEVKIVDVVSAWIYLFAHESADSCGVMSYIEATLLYMWRDVIHRGDIAVYGDCAYMGNMGRHGDIHTKPFINHLSDCIPFMPIYGMQLSVYVRLSLSRETDSTMPSRVWL